MKLSIEKNVWVDGVIIINPPIKLGGIQNMRKLILTGNEVGMFKANGLTIEQRNARKKVGA